ncbi:MAG: CDP-diacylglycerol--glycerol-3-phosphate 3-phosphatidyltransferase [Pirellulales bacterium]|nr:CDP-diacylglycerol--glycerol-3-phosphate 3-phosphatidyltransferase [Pirellulales bacterium]
MAGLGVVWNVPNVLTVSRLVLSIVCFVVLSLESYLPALVLFSIAAGTDWVDGFWARRYGQITQLGRILDPFADKIIICGTFTFLAAVPPPVPHGTASEITAWMAVVVVARELLVTALRSFFEEHGTDFSAKWSGKWKMVLQCAAVASSLARLWYYGYGSGAWSELPAGQSEPPTWTTWLLRLAVWSAVALTVYSGWVYVQRAIMLLRKREGE